MKSQPECLQCFLKHALECARMVTQDEKTHLRVLRAVLRKSATLDMRQSPPVMVQFMHRVIRRAVENADPYRSVKRLHNALALKLLPRLEKRVRRAKDPFEAAVRFAIAGNCIDMGTRKEIDERHILAALERAASAPILGDVQRLAAALKRAQDILFLADNAGEIVFDRLLLERLPRQKVTVAVRGSPILNDATMEDARAAGLVPGFKVIGNGSDAPGTVLSDCSREFQKRFREADLVVSKGQGNFETLSDANKHIFFLFLAKCGLICRQLGRRENDLVILERKPGVRRGRQP